MPAPTTQITKFVGNEASGDHGAAITLLSRTVAYERLEHTCHRKQTRITRLMSDTFFLKAGRPCSAQTPGLRIGAI